MRVLYVTSNSYLRSTTSSLNAIFAELRPRGLSPVMIFQERGPWQQRLEADGVPCYFNDLRVPDKHRPVELAKATWRLARIVSRERIELIHCNEQDHYPVMRAAAKVTRRPIMATLHSRITAAWGHWAFGMPFLPACLQFLSRAQLDATRAALPQALPDDRLKLLMSGLAIDEFLADRRSPDRDAVRLQWGASPDTVVLGTASGIHPVKRLEDFVELIARLRRRGLAVKGVIAGGAPFIDPAYADGLVAHIVREGLQNHCLLLGNLDPILPFHKGIDVTVNTSETEALSMSLCESMACGKPALAYAVGGNPETVHDSWCVVPFGDIDALEERAARLATDEDFRRREGSRAERHVREQFDAPALGKRQALIYGEILGQKLRD